MSRRGENIYKRKDKRWEGRYKKGFFDGKTRYGYVYAHSYGEVKEKLAIAVRAVEQEKEISRQEREGFAGRSFQEMAQAWFESIKPQIKASTAVKYHSMLTVYLYPRFGEIEVENFTREMISEYERHLLEKGGRNGCGLSPKTVNDILSIVKNVLCYAEQYGNFRAVNICGLAIRQPQKPLRVLSVKEQQRLSQYLCDHPTLTNMGILICLYTGLRIGEICALKWEDILTEEQCLYVHKTMQRLQCQEVLMNDKKTQIIISKPKSESSIRRIPLPDDVFRLLIGWNCPGDTFFLTGVPQVFVEPRTMQNRFQAVLRECQINKANFHVLRHTFATRCIEFGFDVKSLSEILGHASVNITLNRYVHPSMEQKKKNMEMLSGLFAVR